MTLEGRGGPLEGEGAFCHWGSLNDDGTLRFRLDVRHTMEVGDMGGDRLKGNTKGKRGVAPITRR